MHTDIILHLYFHKNSLMKISMYKFNNKILNINQLKSGKKFEIQQIITKQTAI